MEKKHPISEVMGITMEKVKEMVDVNTIVGTPITTAEGITVVPISKVSFGFASGGSDFATKNQPADKDNAFGGGAGAGVNIDPVGFLVIRNDTVKLIPVAPVPGGPVEKVIDMVPDMVDKVAGMVDKRKTEKAEKAAAEAEAQQATDAAEEKPQ
ncbi:MAG: GerW family sporulation protein [Clostridiales bacterium]|nr:GerW family sporulation protein [Clostridiales bacterium]